MPSHRLKSRDSNHITTIASEPESIGLVVAWCTHPRQAPQMDDPSVDSTSGKNRRFVSRSKQIAYCSDGCAIERGLLGSMDSRQFPFWLAQVA